MKFLMGILIGGGVGYILGTRDGRERFDEIVESLSEVIGEETVAQIADFLDQSGSEMRRAASESIDAASEVVDDSTNAVQEAIDEA